MGERMNFQMNTVAGPADRSARPAEPTRLLPLFSGPPSALASPVAGCRILMTIAQNARDGETRPLVDDMAFEDALALAAHLAARDMEVVLASVGEPFLPDDLRMIARLPGVRIWEGRRITSPQEDAAACVADLEAAASAGRADLLLLHDPALAAARRVSRPTIVICEGSRLMEWRQRHGDAPAPEAVRAAAALERLGLHAADRVITPSRSFANELVALHGLTLPPAVVPPVFRKPAPHDKRAGETGFVTAGAAQADPADLVRLDRAAAHVYGQVLLFDMRARDPGQALCLEHVHRLPPMDGAAAQALLLRATAFCSPSSGCGFERLVWRAASAGCAMILPDTKVHREFWQGAAHFISARSEDALAAALRRMLEDDDYRRRTAAAALRRARAMASGPVIATLHKVLAGALGAAPLTATLQGP
jgi:hypothetical protein